MKRLLLIFALGICCHAEAANMCWVERIAKHNGDLRVYMSAGNLNHVRTIERVDGTRSTPEKDDKPFFTLKEGESAYLSTLPHDVCTAKAISENGAFGLKLSANTCMHGIGCRSATQFLPAE